MSTKTIHNLNLINLEMYETSERGDYKGLKALSHSYETLLSQLNYSHEDFEKEIIRTQIPRQVKLTEDLHEKLETISIPKLLGEGNYIEVNHLTTTVARLNNILSILHKLYADISERFVPKVIVFSNSKRGDDFLWENLIKNNGEKVLSQAVDFRATKVLTDKNSYTLLYKVTESFRGRRYDYIYIDKELDEKTKDFCRNFSKEKHGVAIF